MEERLFNIKPKNKVINTLDIAELRAKVIKNRVEIPAPKNKEEMDGLREFYTGLAEWYKSEIKRIETEILPRLNKL